MKDTEQIIKIIEYNSKFESEIFNLLRDITDIVHHKCIDYKIEHIRFIKQKTLKEKHLLTQPLYL